MPRPDGGAWTLSALPATLWAGPFEGLMLWALEPGLTSGKGLWLTSDGPLNEAPTEAGKRFAAQCHACHIAWFLFFSDLNAFGYVAGSRAAFAWA